MFKVLPEVKLTLSESVDLMYTALSLSQNKIVYEILVLGNLNLVRYKQLKFRLQGKFCGKITTTDG